MKKLLTFVGCSRYEVHDNGDIINRVTGRYIEGSFDGDGYNLVALYTDDSNYTKTKTFRRHVLVAKAFLPNPESKRTVNHKDANKQHNWLANLEWNTDKENIGHARKNSLYSHSIERERYNAIDEAIKARKGWHHIRDTFHVGTSTISNIKKKGLVSWEEYYG